MTPLLFVGDSITRAWADSEASLFASRGWCCTARPGETTGAIGRRLDADLALCRPGRVHILCGINDIAENAGPYDPDGTKRNLAAMMAACASHGAACTIATLLPAESVPWRPGLEVGSKVNDLVAWTRDVCRSLPCGSLIDYHLAFLTYGHQSGLPLTIDGVHPNAEGLQILTRTLLAGLRA